MRWPSPAAFPKKKPASNRLKNKRNDQRFDSVSCPEWGGDVRVRGLTAYEQSYIATLVGDEKKNEVTLKVVQFGCVDEEGGKMFTTDDMAVLKTKSYAVIERLGKRILELTGLGDQDEIEAARKN